jgi:hypothetical protein
VGARALAKLTALTSLDLSENEIEAEGAHALTTLTGLISLDLSGNRIGAKGARALLESWCETSTLRILDLSGNGNMRSLLPPEVLASGNAQSILAAYRRYREAKIRNELRPLNEAKLVVVGNEAVGKTSLIRYLVHGKPRNPDEKKTPGTAIHEKIEDQLREAVAASTSYKLVCRRLGLSENGGNMYHLRARARELGLDASHFGAGTIDRCTDDDIRHAVASSMSFVGVFEVLGVRPGGTSNAKLRARIQELGLETTHFRYSSGRHRGAWTDDDLRAAVASSKSFAQVIRKLGLVPAGGNYVQVQRRIGQLALDTSRFTGSGWNSGLKHRPRPRAPLEQVLVADRPTGSHKLKQRLIRAGLKPPACELCGWAVRASDGRIPVELDHINGNRADNRLENLRVLCPNCHSLQPTHRGLNLKGRQRQ